MQLVTLTLEAYRRFFKSTSIKLHSDLVALVGPNEAGKSSILKALTHLNHDAPFERNERPRRSTALPNLKWQLQLEQTDREALASVPEATQITRVTITKSTDGVRAWEFFPAPVRSRTRRLASRDLITGERASIASLSEQAGVLVEDDLLIQTLSSENEWDDIDTGVLEAYMSQIGSVLDAIPPAEISGSADSNVRSIIAGLTDLLAFEHGAHPAALAQAALEPRLPIIRLFDVADRDLQKEYDLNDAADSPPPALRHLAALAGLDLPAMRDEIMAGEIANAATRRNAANTKLLEMFKYWNQESIALQIDFQGSILHIQVTTAADSGLSSIDERSDGMRWFAMLLAFTQGSGDKPILLADEIETHLHYDAQADLIEVLSTQNLTSKIIYTTHSFGCLPNDLGNGVRAVKQVTAGTSAVENGFWKDGSGFSPLLVSMGAAAVTFTPTRRAIIAEGATEAIMLPTVLRQAAELTKLDFQVAPGLSSVASTDVPSLESEAGHVGYLVDGDGGGLAIRDKLMDHLSSSKIVVLRDAKTNESMETEDLIDTTVYVKAVNEEIQLWNEITEELLVDEIPRHMRTKAVDEWCKDRNISSPDKAAVAQRVVNASSEHTVFAKDRRPEILELLRDLRLTLA